MSTSGLNRTGHTYECLTQTGPDAKFARHVLPDWTGLAPNLYYEVICVYVSQQVEVAPSLVADCKKPLHQNRWFWGLGIGFFKSDANLRATFQNFFGERAL